MNIKDQSTMELKLTRKLLYEDFQYGSGDIVVAGERNVLHLYEAEESVPHSGSPAQKNFNFRKENNLVNVHGK